MSKYFRHLLKIFDFQRTIKLSSHRFYDHKIELLSDNNTLFWNRVYSLFELKLQKFKKYLKNNLRKTLSCSIKSHMFRQFYSQSNSMINYVYVWIIDDSITSRNVIDISFRWSKKLWSKYKIASIWSSWISYSSSTNFEWMKRMRNSSRLLFQWDRTNIEYYHSN